MKYISNLNKTRKNYYIYALWKNYKLIDRARFAFETKNAMMWQHLELQITKLHIRTKLPI